MSVNHHAHGAAPDSEEVALLGELIERGLLVESGVPGVYGHGAAFEDVRARLDALVSAETAARGAESLRFPPLLPRRQMELMGYLGSFPHLAGSVYAFEGNEAQATTQADRASRHEDWGDFQTMTATRSIPAS